MALEASRRINKKLTKIVKDLGNDRLRVGFLENATYPDGTPVAAVAFWNEFGKKNQPPRPFFRRMIAKESSSWPGKLKTLVKRMGKDSKKVLGALGEDIKGALVQSINDFTSPPIKRSTALRKGFDKPLIDDAIMINSVGSEVVKG